jgi:uncharacterized protein YodC (DUF2158 family)
VSDKVEIKIGSVVYLKTKVGPRMTITFIHSDDLVGVCWFNDALDYQTAIIPVACLVIVNC